MLDLANLYSALSESPQGSSHPGSWLVKVPAPARVDHLADLNAGLIRNRRPSRRRRVLLAAARFAATFFIGVIATLAWQPYGDAAREMIVNSSQQLGWLGPQAGAAVISFPSPGQHHGAASDLDAVQERIDRIASSQEQVTRTVAQLTVSQGQIAQEITQLREIEQYLLYKASYKATDSLPRPAPAHKPTRRTPLSIAQH
jgi:hypothetical protein